MSSPAQPVPWKPPVGPLLGRLDAYAATTGRSRNAVITAAVTALLDAAGAEPPETAEAAITLHLEDAEPHARWAVVYQGGIAPRYLWGDYVVCGAQDQAVRVVSALGGTLWGRTPARGWQPVQPETTGEAGR